MYDVFLLSSICSQDLDKNTDFRLMNKFIVEIKIDNSETLCVPKVICDMNNKVVWRSVELRERNTERDAEMTSILRFAAIPVAILFKFKIQLGSGIFAGVVIIMRELENSKSDKA